ncbi:unnamed protein product [Somion occarium]|uniref:Copper-fist domain-containing protein n=1 Tax=Somion occarium TaxID=3059160 RepID=A0ABP1DNU7_9APHY
MVFVGDRKYACETCIKGHRSSTCKHTDRPLFEIKKKGRPVTQCEHCRELRKTRQVHVKCICEQKDESEGSSSRGLLWLWTSIGGKKVPVSAVFPAGLPEAMEASVALQLLSESSDSEYSSPSSSQCGCKDNGSCDCCIPRVPTSRSRRLGKDRMAPVNAGSDTTQPDGGLSTPVSRPAGLVDLANSGSHRPVLPRPSPQRPASPAGPVHRPSPASHGSRHQVHNQNLYSPYGRAYEYAHGVEAMPGPSTFHTAPEHSVSTPSPTPMTFPHADDSILGFLTAADSSMSNLCNCGPNCSCPGCVIHRGPTFDPSAFQSCNNPGACFACANCNLFALPLSETTTAAQDFSPFETPESLDEWFRQLSSVPDPTTVATNSIPSGSSSSSPPYPSPQTPSDFQSMPFNPALWQSYALWSNLQNQTNAQPAPEECCGGRCKCPPGMCNCAADCCGCCQGCTCADCNHEDSGDRVTFAVSGERDACCGGPNTTRSVNRLTNAHNVASSSTLLMPGDWSHPSLTSHRNTTLSRASSTSSRASSQHSHSSSSLASVHSAPASETRVIGSCCSSLQSMATSSQPNIPSTHPSMQHRTLNENGTGFDMY